MYRYVIFILASFLMLAIAVILQAYPDTSIQATMADILINAGVSLLAVSVIDAGWRYLIGDPILKSIEDFSASIVALQELRDTGVIHLHKRRDDFLERNRMAPLLQRIQTAHAVNMTGRVLHRSWAVSSEFTNIMRERASAGQCTFRILLLDPEGPAAIRRDEQEVGTGAEKGLMLGNIKASIRIFTGIINGLPPEARDRIQLRLLGDVEPHAQIIIVDNYAWIQLYLYHVRGGSSPSIEVEGNQSPIYRLYNTEFDRMWEVAQPIPAV